MDASAQVKVVSAALVHDVSWPAPPIALVQAHVLDRALVEVVSAALVHAASWSALPIAAAQVEVVS